MNETDVLLTSLYAAHVRTVDAGVVSQVLLGHASSEAKPSDGGAERHQLWRLRVAGGWLRHMVIISR